MQRRPELAETSYKTALVTGASRGIGAAIARKLVQGGLTVYAVARSGDVLAALREELGERLIPLPGDVLDVAGILRDLGDKEIDVLVNNAGGISSVRPLTEQTATDTAAIIALNLTAPLVLTQALLPGMIARARGHVFNLTSTAARGVLPGTATYAACKAGITQAGHVLRYELAGSGVRLTDLAPARVRTDIYLESFGGDRAGLEEKLFAGHRVLTPEDVADTLWAALCLPSHVNLAEVVITSTDQAAGGQRFEKR
jgi:NADP-dependent 3-hydroxy acid dehydrogenase YdfG